MEITKHFEEPLFSIAVTGFLIVLVRAWMGQGIIADGLFVLLAMLAMVSGYFTYLYLKAGETKKNIGIPLFLVLTLYFSYLADQSGTFLRRDYIVFAITAGMALLSYALYLHKIIKPTYAAMATILTLAMMVHIAPAMDLEGVQWHGKYIGGIDPYFHYRLSTYIVDGGYVPEKEPLAYPQDPPEFHMMTLMGATFMGALGALLKPFGISIFDIAMIYPGLIGALAVIPFYVLIKELFTELKPNNKIAGILGALMLALSPAFAINASAAMCEDDALGAFFFILTSMFFVMAIKRKNILYALASCLSGAILALSWGGVEYIMLTFGIFVCITTILNFVGKRNCMENIPYFAIALVGIPVSLTAIIHQQGVFDMTLSYILSHNWIYLATTAGTIALATFLEALRVYKYGKIKIEKKHEDFQGVIYLLAAVVLLLGAILLVALNPVTLTHQIIGMLGVKPTDIIAQTTAEQTALCGDWFSKDCVNALKDRFGVGVLAGVLMIPILAYWGITRKSDGALFIIVWSLPIMWGVLSKVAYLFISSVPITALGATIALIIPLSMKELNSPLKTIMTLTFLCLITVSSISSPLFVLDSIGGSKAMYFGTMGDRIYWDPTLQWMKNNVKENEVIVTWWDYGHWITSVAGKRSLLDNTKARPFMVQDIAKLHVIIDNETDAVKMMQKYDAKYWVVDYTMIQKSGAPYYIATANITSETKGKSLSYLPCIFQPSYSDLKGAVKSNGDGTFTVNKQLVFACADLALMFDISEDRVVGVRVLTSQSRSTVTWGSWQQNTGASILGIQSIQAVLGNCLNYGTNNYIDFPTYTQLVYVPKELNKVVMTSTYLGDFQDSYKALGLASQDVQKMPKFKRVNGFTGDRDDYSYLGYVRVYEVSNETQTA